jgi:hypothetical protein
VLEKAFEGHRDPGCSKRHDEITGVLIAQTQLWWKLEKKNEI